MLNREVLEKLIAHYKDDLETLDFIRMCLDSFEEYHRAVFDDQMFRIVYGVGTLDADEYKERRSAVDRTRTTHHNSVIMNVGVLNRMAAEIGLDPLYDGVVSEERPYRREVANAVFAYVETVINERT